MSFPKKSLEDRLILAEKLGHTFIMTKMCQPVAILVKYVLFDKIPIQNPFLLISIVLQNALIIANGVALLVIFLLPLVLSILLVFDPLINLASPINSTVIFLILPFFMITLSALNRHSSHFSFRRWLYQVSTYFVITPSFVKGCLYKLLGRRISLEKNRKRNALFPLLMLLGINIMLIPFLNENRYLILWSVLNVIIMASSLVGFYLPKAEQKSPRKGIKVNSGIFHLLSISILVYGLILATGSINVRALTSPEDLPDTIYHIYLALFSLLLLASVLNQVILFSNSLIRKQVKR